MCTKVARSMCSCKQMYCECSSGTDGKCVTAVVVSSWLYKIEKKQQRDLEGWVAENVNSTQVWFQNTGKHLVIGVGESGISGVTRITKKGLILVYLTWSGGPKGCRHNKWCRREINAVTEAMIETRNFVPVSHGFLYSRNKFGRRLEWDLSKSAVQATNIQTGRGGR